MDKTQKSPHPLKKLFGNFSLSWKFLIVFSCIIGISVGIFARIPFLENTSFSDFAVYLDIWIILAIFIIINCKTRKEAILKTFIFFLISQPLIYLTEVLIDTAFYSADFISHLVMYFNNYYFHGGNWFLWTLLTIPGSALAFEIKKGTIISALILSVATGFLAFSGASTLLKCILANFPLHLLSALLSLVFAFLLIWLILPSKTPRIVAIFITSVAIIAGIVYYFVVISAPQPECFPSYTYDETTGELIPDGFSCPDSST